MTAENQTMGKTGEVGRLLRAAREESRQNLRDVAERLRIRYQFLEAIEEGRYQDLPGAAYATGFVRAYAEYLGLDGLEVARRFKEEGAVGKMSNELAFPIPAAESGLPSRSLLLAGVALLAVVYGVWHYVGSPDKPLADVVQDIPDRIAALMRSTPDAEDALKREPVIAPAAEAPAPAPVLAPQVAAAPVSPVPPPAPEKPAATETAQEPIGTAEADVEPPAEEHDDAPAAVTPLPAPTVALPSAPTPAATPAPTPVAKPIATQPGATPVTKPAAPTPTPAPVAAAVTPPAAPPSKPVVAPQTASVPAKPVTPVPAPAPVQAPATPAAASVPAKPASPLAALPSQPAAPVAAPSATTAATPARVEPTTAPVERQGTDAATDAPSSQGRVFGEENNGARVMLRARADSWVQVRNSDGLLMSRLLRKGDSYMVPNQGGLELMTGNAGGLDIVVDGKVLPTLGKTGEVRKGIPLQAEALKSGAATAQ